MQILSDDQIGALLREAKPFPAGLSPLTNTTEKNLHVRKDWTLTAASGNTFVIKVRRSVLNPFNFSVILGYQLPNVHRVFRLRRYNGNSHRHTNIIEKQVVTGFHVHSATQRYQTSGFSEDAFAERTDRYYDLPSAVDCMLAECGFKSPDDGPLFRQGGAQ
jgi:hypothetical protein